MISQQEAKELGFVQLYTLYDGWRCRCPNRLINRQGDILKRDGSHWSYIKPRYDKDGYNRINLPIVTKNCQTKFVACFGHRCVATTFNISEKEAHTNIVNHLNHSQFDNRADNLEWTTAEGNARHARETKQFARPWPDYPILQIKEMSNKEWLIVGRFLSLRDIPKRGNFCHQIVKKDVVRKCCMGWQTHHRGFRWIYAKDLPTDSTIKINEVI